VTSGAAVVTGCDCLRDECALASVCACPSFVLLYGLRLRAQVWTELGGTDHNQVLGVSCVSTQSTMCEYSEYPV
jgi:hypothetical protein